MRSLPRRPYFLFFPVGSLGFPFLLLLLFLLAIPSIFSSSVRKGEGEEGGEESIFIVLYEKREKGLRGRSWEGKEE